jgi:hypothetical protein
MLRSSILAAVALGCTPHPSPSSATDPVGSSDSTAALKGEHAVSAAEPGLTASPSGSAEPAPSTSAVASLPPPPLPEGTVVLHVGSSTAGALGLELKKELEARGVKCILRAKESTYIPEWAGEKMGLRQLIAQYKPDLVIVSLGGNEVEINDPTRRIKAIQRLVAMLGDRPCVWVGTPRWKRLHHTGLMEVIRDHSAPCRYVDSDELAPNLETLKDGVHPTMRERSRWAKRMIQWLELNRDPNADRPWAFKTELSIPEDPPPAEETLP